MEMTDRFDGDTIVAAATAVGRSGVAVVRLSGSDSLKIISSLSGRKDFLPRRAEFCIIKCGDISDEAVVIYFAAPASYTGEDVAEIHCHGNPLIVRAIIEFCMEHGARIAQAGEFTRRAFTSGKMDLTAAEAVYDIIAAETTLQLSSAEQLKGGWLYTKVSSIESQLYDMIAELNVAIDYPEEDVEQLTAVAVKDRAAELAEELSRLASTYKQGRMIREGVKVAIFGAPNVGKSSLLNRLLGRERAIVSAQAGTTRDTVEDRFEYKGMLFVIVDTAGVRRGAEQIEQLGINRAYAAAEECDIILAVCDIDCDWIQPPKNKPTVFVRNKIDLSQSYQHCSRSSIAAPAQAQQADRASSSIQSPLEISALCDSDVEQIKEELYQKSCLDTGKGYILTNLRHYEAIKAAAQCLDNVTRLASTESTEIFAIELQEATVELGKISGLIASDEVVSRIFSKFCVGK